MTLLPHQERVVKEQLELREKIDKLLVFCGTPLFFGLSQVEQSRLIRQLNVMSDYESILLERIKAFTETKS